MAFCGFNSGIAFSSDIIAEMKKMNQSFYIMKSMVKMIVDSCILPGTALGAEILWVYVKEWRNQISMTSLALLSFAFLLTAHAGIVTAIIKPVTEQENTK